MIKLVHASIAATLFSLAALAGCGRLEAPLDEEALRESVGNEKKPITKCPKGQSFCYWTGKCHPVDKPCEPEPVPDPKPSPYASPPKPAK